jgi:hypothetical protein
MANSKIRWDLPSAPLPTFVAERIAESKLAALMSNSPVLRKIYVIEIATLHTRKDLESLGFGAITIGKLEAWLLHRGARLRKTDESLDSVICGFDVSKLARLARRVGLLETAHRVKRPELV